MKSPEMPFFRGRTEGQINALFVSRLERLIRLRREYREDLNPLGIRLLDRAIYATYRDCCEYGAEEPAKYWLSNLPAQTPLTQLVSLAKLRWRIEHDYRELKDALGLDHFEGRSFRGWHHHVTLVSIAHAFLTLERLDPKADAPA